MILIDKEIANEYFDKIKKYKVLSNAEQLKLFKNLTARNRQVLITTNLGLVVNIALQYNYVSIPLVDLVQYGNIGLIQAVDNFNPKKNVTFSTYATYWIKAVIKRSISNYNSLVRIPVCSLTDKLKYQKFVNIYENKTGQKPTDEVLQQAFKCSKEHLQRIKNINIDYPITIDTPVTENLTIEDVLQDIHTNSIDEHYNEAFWRCLDKFNKKDRYIILSYYKYNLTEIDIAKNLRITRQAVHIRKKKVLEQLKNNEVIKEYL